MLNIINDGVALGGVKEGSVLVWGGVLIEPRFLNAGIFGPYKDPTSSLVWDPFSGGRAASPEEEEDFNPTDVSPWMVEIVHTAYKNPIWVVFSAEEVYHLLLREKELETDDGIVGLWAVEGVKDCTAMRTFPVRRQRLERMARKTILHLEKNEDGKWEDTGGYKYQPGFTGSEDADIKTAFRLDPETGEIREWGWSYSGSHPFDL